MATRVKRVPFPPWLTRAKDGIEKRYCRIGATILASDAMRSLSPSAFKIYCYMLIESAGNREFEFPYRKYKDYMSRPTFTAARDELVKHGFIEIAQNNKNLRKANVYRFTDTWKTYIKPM